VLCCFSFYSHADQLDPGGYTQLPSGDDRTWEINLGHVFPYYGGQFTNAWMSSNGFIMLYDPNENYGNPNTNYNGCCSGFDPLSSPGYLQFMIAPLWTDLIDRNYHTGDGYYYETGEGGTSLLWYKLCEYGDWNHCAAGNYNTFAANLWPDGSFDFIYDDISIRNHNVWIGHTGDITNDTSQIEELLFYNTSQTDMTLASVADISDQAWYDDQGNVTSYAWWGTDGGYSSGPDCSNPLNDPSCEGYEEAYFNQQCDADPFYDNQCPGYEQAYYDLQCSLDPLYDSNCPGYEQAYYDMQCSMNPLYDNQCPGYEEAYFEQQCDANPLYDSQCEGYEEAYFDQQCSIDALYDAQCPGYQEAYDQKLFEEACTADPLYDTQCDGYEEALAIKMQEEALQEQLEEQIPDPTPDPTKPEDDFSGQDTGAVIDDGSEYKEEEVFVEEEPYVEEVFVEPIKEEEIFLEEITEVEVFEEDIIELTEDPIEIKEEIIEEPVEELEDILEEEPVVVEEVIEEEPEVIEEVEKEASPERRRASTNVLDIVMNVLAEDRELTQQNISQQQQVIQQMASGSVASSTVESSEALSQGEVVVTSGATIPGQEASESEQIEMLEESSFAAVDQTFEAQMSDSFAAGGNIGTFLSGSTPDYGKFDVAPPSVSQQRVLDRAESLADKMSEEEISDLLESRLDQLEEAGGFEGDQTITLLLMNGQTSLALYYANILLLQQTPDLWYAERLIYKGKLPKDNNALFLQGVRDNETKMRELVETQYRR